MLRNQQIVLLKRKSRSSRENDGSIVDGNQCFVTIRRRKLEDGFYRVLSWIEFTCFEDMYEELKIRVHHH